MKKLVFAICASIILISVAHGQNDDIRSKQYNTKKAVALEGYDPVSYFSNKPTEGKSQLSFTYKSITYWFSSQSNLDKFKANPDQYEPAYGGWCAYAMGETGEKVKIDPETYKILNNRLYLFYNFWGNNTLMDWNKNETALKSKADVNWKKIVQ
ncbi:MAG: YHS domain-containing (seleno)protein [Cyclobacteriaceae bacterium]